MSFLKHFFKNHKGTALAVVALLAIIFISKVFAVPPFSPGVINDPTCGPLDTDCTVDLGPAGGAGAVQFTTDGNFFAGDETKFFFDTDDFLLTGSGTGDLQMSNFGDFSLSSVSGAAGDFSATGFGDFAFSSVDPAGGDFEATGLGDVFFQGIGGGSPGAMQFADFGDFLFQSSNNGDFQIGDIGDFQVAGGGDFIVNDFTDFTVNSNGGGFSLSNFGDFQLSGDSSGDFILNSINGVSIVGEDSDDFNISAFNDLSSSINGDESFSSGGGNVIRGSKQISSSGLVNVFNVTGQSLYITGTITGFQSTGNTFFGDFSFQVDAINSISATNSSSSGTFSGFTNTATASGTPASASLDVNGDGTATTWSIEYVINRIQ
jgi:hypothetical protein